MAAIEWRILRQVNSENKTGKSQHNKATSKITSIAVTRECITISSSIADLAPNYVTGDEYQNRELGQPKALERPQRLKARDKQPALNT